MVNKIKTIEIIRNKLFQVKMNIDYLSNRDSNTRTEGKQTIKLIDEIFALLDRL